MALTASVVKGEVTHQGWETWERLRPPVWSLPVQLLSANEQTACHSLVGGGDMDEKGLFNSVNSSGSVSY